MEADTATAESASQTDVPDVVNESMFGALDLLLLGALAVAAVWWLFLREKRKQPDQQPFRQYTIQPSAAPSLSSDSGFLSKMKSANRNFVVFYGSQTGTAEEFAGRLAKEAARFSLKGMVADPEECDMNELSDLKDIPNSLAVLCLATYGEGDPTDNAQELYEWLQAGDADLDGVNYAVFGLGNKTYEHYNEMAKYADQRLADMGATRVFELGMGDDDANIEDDFITWKDRFWPAVCDFFGIEASGDEVNMRQYRLVVHNTEELVADRIYHGEVARLHSYRNQRPPFDAKNPFMSTIRVNRELHKGGDRSCLHIELDIEGSRMRYDTGDHVAVYPINDEALVNRIGELLDVDLDTVVSLVNLDEDSSKKHPFPCPTSYRTALLHYVDITSPPRSHVLKELAEYAKDPEDQQKMRLMSSTTPEGKELYQQWIHTGCRNIVHILEDLPSCKPPLDHICELLPRLQARYYSISSSPKVYPTTIHITAVVVEYDTPTGRRNNGVATSYLKVKRPDNGFIPQVPVFVRKSQFRLPTRPQTPIIMIGPGTGLAPFRGFLQERDYLRKEGKPVGETVLYFGCRYKAEDFIYEEELNEYIESGLLKLHVAFSRDQAHKVYVTHLLKENGKEIWRLIGEGNGHLYVCGDARNMARDVHDLVSKIIQEEGGLSENDALAYVKKMEAQKRYSADVWS